jgi:predicted Zn-dependent protease
LHLPARLTLVALLAAAGAEPAFPSEAPLRPVDPDYVVAELPGGASRAQQRLAGQLEDARKDPGKAALLARELLEQARATQQPQLYGRAESVLAAWVGQPQAPAELLVMQADILQQRHEFQDATRLLDTVITRDPHNRQARLMRANNAIVTGQFASARPDCAWLLGTGEPWMGSVCLAQVLGSTGQRDQARALLQRLTAGGSPSAPEVFAWALQVQADLDSRAGELASAERLLRQALDLTPASDPVRLALADVLATQGQRAAAERVLEMTRPSVGARLRQMELLAADRRDAQRAEALAELQERLAVSAQRGERAHLREETRLALDLAREPAHAAALARDNFAVQRETEDVRLLARAAVGAADAQALAQLKQWLLVTGYQDVVVQRLLAGINT